MYVGFITPWTTYAFTPGDYPVSLAREGLFLKECKGDIFLCQILILDVQGFSG